MSTDLDNNPIENNVLFNLEQQFRQLVLESKSNELTIKSTQEHLNNSLKHNALLERELETERQNKLMMKIKLDTLTTLTNRSNNRSELNVNVLLNDQKYLTNKIYKIQIENMELKRALSKSNNQLSSLMENQYKYTERINVITSTMNSIQVQMKKLAKESNILLHILCNSKILINKMLSALEYLRTLNKTQFDNMEHLIKEVANIKSKLHMLIDQNEKQQIMKTDKKSTTSSNQTHLEICRKVVEILEVENNSLHKYIHQLLEKKTSKNNIHTFTK